MEKKICELKLNETQAVVGGALSYTAPATYSPPIKPMTSTSSVSGSMPSPLLAR